MPRVLTYLLLAVFVVGLAWVLVVPPWQAPDENSHFGYTQVLAERLELPGAVPGTDPFSSEYWLAAIASNSDQTAAIRIAKPEWSPEAYARWQEVQRELVPDARGNGRGREPVTA